MRTISVKETAAALGLSARAVQYKLQNGDLKGIRSKNQYGVLEWRVYPTKEIAEALNKPGLGTDEISFDPNEVETVDAESYASEIETSAPRSWLGPERETIRTIAEEMVKPLLDTIKEQTTVINEKERLIEEQGRQLRLLPDLQKLAESERQTAELKTLEIEALRKQIVAMEWEQSKAAEENEQAWKQQITALKEKQAAALEQERRAASEKAAEVKVVQEQLTALSVQMQELKQPWWKKWFSTGE